MSEDAIYTEREQNDDITLQFGFHGEFNDRYALFEQGNLDACGWPDEGMRSRLIKEQPQVLAIDSLCPDSDNITLERYISWLYLPLRPNKLNLNGEVKVLFGDTVSLPVAFDLGDGYTNARISVQEKYKGSLSSELGKLEYYADMALATGVGYAAKTIGSMMEGEKKNDTSRRAFFRRTGKGINAVGKAAVGIGVAGFMEELA